MHDIWNPWHGCVKKSEGCENCYMMYLDKIHKNYRDEIYRTHSFSYPLSKNRDGSYKIKSGERIRVCMNSDFFIEEADSYRDEAFAIMKKRSDVIFYILTKRPERVATHLPADWNDGYPNVYFNVTIENQARANERLPILKSLPFKHKGVMTAPLLGAIDIEEFLKEGFIEEVICGGENYGGSRPCNFDWVKSLSEQCKRQNVTFAFIETGTIFIKDNKEYHLKNKLIQAKMAYKANVSFKGIIKPYKLYDVFGNQLSESKLYKPQYTSVNCAECGNRIICNGCSNCGRCKQINT